MTGTFDVAQNSTPIFECVPDAFRNFFGFIKYECRTSFFGTDFPLSKAWGYVIILGFGLVFGLFTVGLVYLETLLTGQRMNSEFFNTAGRTIKTGLTASVLVSQWTWAATLLQSSNVAYQYGVSGPFWYASGATIQILLFSSLAVLVKRRAPTSHTFLEIIRARWGPVAHIVFTFFALMTNVIVTSMLILGGSATVNALTSINTDLASFLIPLGVIVYTLAGGLKATFIASYFNTAVILISLCIFIFQVYVTNEDLGSPTVVWTNLNQVIQVDGGVDGNYGHSYLTMISKNGLFFGLTNIVGNFGTVFVDQSYWQSAIAATPEASWKGYLLGGLCWFAIPFSLATSLGLASVALSLPVTLDEANAGLVPPAVAQHLLGRGGAVLILIMLFMAVTSTGAAEQIAVSSLVAYDIFRTYFRPNATGAQIILISRIVIAVFGLLMGVFGIVLNKIGIGLGWLYLFMGVVIGSAVIPVAFSISWRKASGLGAICGAIGGAVLAISAWLIFGSTYDGGITVDNLGREPVMLVGNLVAILSSGFICVVISLIRPDDCDWTATKSISLVEEDKNATLSQATDDELKRAMKIIGIVGIVLTIVLVIAWPVLTLPVRAFPLGYFKFWVVLSFIWGLLATGAMLFLPVWESRGIFWRIVNRKKVDNDTDDDMGQEEGGKAATVPE